MAPRDENIEHMIDEVNTLGTRLTPWEISFMESITDQWERKRWLSDDQYRILSRIYEERVR